MTSPSDDEAPLGDLDIVRKRAQERDIVREREQARDEWNANYPIGTPVAAWLLTRDEHPLWTRTRSKAWLLGGVGPACVLVEERAGGVALSHIEPVDYADVRATLNKHRMFVSSGGYYCSFPGCSWQYVQNNAGATHAHDRAAHESWVHFHFPPAGRRKAATDPTDRDFEIHHGDGRVTIVPGHPAYCWNPMRHPPHDQTYVRWGGGKGTYWCDGKPMY